MSIERLRSALDALWAEVTGLDTLEPDVVQVAKENHEILWHDAPDPMVSHCEWGLRIDCSKEGCDPKHLDDGSIYDKGLAVALVEDNPTVNGHAATLVGRVIGDWHDIPMAKMYGDQSVNTEGAARD